MCIRDSDTAIPHTPQVPHSGTDYPKPTASCEAAPLWGIANLLSPHRFRICLLYTSKSDGKSTSASAQYNDDPYAYSDSPLSDDAISQMAEQGKRCV